MLENCLPYLVATLIVAAMIFYMFARHTYSYWQRKGIPFLPEPSYFFGHLTAVIMQRIPMQEHIIRLYNASSEPFVGMYGLFRPILLVRDPELVQSVLIKDFDHFTDRGLYHNVERDPLSGHLLSLPGEKWKRLRAKLSPAFTSGKLKTMFPTFVECGQGLQNHLDDELKADGILDIREVAAKYGTNIVASVAFGIQIDSFKNPDNDFRKYGRQLFAGNLLNGLRFGLTFLAPRFMSLIGLHPIEADIEKFIYSMVASNLEYREANNFVRKDFFQLLVQLHRTGAMLNDQFQQVTSAGNTDSLKLSLDEMCAQVLLFFVAGFETSSSTMAFCLFELARNPDIQQRVHHELDTALMKHNSVITHESVLEMTYLECCFHETLRKYTVLPALNRECVKDYQIPGTQHIIEKGTSVLIPVLGLQYDEKFYPNPTKFDPDRFEGATFKYRADRPFLGFGDGPRNCIAARMGKLQTIVGLMVSLQHYSYELDDESFANNELKFNPKTFLLTPDPPIKLRIKRR